MFVRFIITTVLMFALSMPAVAAPKAYDFDFGASNIEFTYDFSGDKITGKFPVFDGELLLDFKNLKNSSVMVRIDARKARGGFIFATSALRGAKILHVKKWPYITFRSTSAQVKGGLATVHGNITVRDVTRPITLSARFFQLQGHTPQDRDSLAIELLGTINRNDFGASGYPKFVGKTLDIRIFATINKRP